MSEETLQRAEEKGNNKQGRKVQFSSIQFSCSVVSDSLGPHEPQHARPPLSITNSQSPPRPMFIESVMPSNHLILCCPFLLLPSIFPSIRVFSNESALRIRWPKYWSFSFKTSPTNEHPGLIRKDTKLNVEYQKIARRFMKALLNEQCKEV